MQSHFNTNAISFHHISSAVFQQSVSGRLKTKLSLRVMHLARLQMLILLSGSETTQSEKTPPVHEADINILFTLHSAENS